MKITLKKGVVADTPKEYVRIVLTEKTKGTKQFIKEKNTLIADIRDSPFVNYWEFFKWKIYDFVDFFPSS